MGISIQALIALLACSCAGAQGPAFHGSADAALAATSGPRSTDCNTPLDAVPAVDYGGNMAIAEAARLPGPLGAAAGVFTVIEFGSAVVVGGDALSEHVATRDLRDQRDRCRAHDQQVTAFQRSRTKALTLDARQLTQLAAEAARAGDCAQARRLEGAVDDQDPAVHDTVFVRDPAIRRCLASK